jgi:hypothetical protein
LADLDLLGTEVDEACDIDGVVVACEGGDVEVHPQLASLEIRRGADVEVGAVGGGVAEPNVGAVAAQHGPAGGRRPERRDGFRVGTVEHDDGDRGQITERRRGVVADRPLVADDAEPAAFRVGNATR